MYFTSPIFGRRVFNLGLNNFLRADIKVKGGVSCVWFGYEKPRLTLTRY